MTRMLPPEKGLLAVVSGPSGSGKTTLCRRFIEEHPDAAYTISATTRPMRSGEQDGKDYHFLSRELFVSKLEAGEFLEYAEVHGNLYGTLKSEVLGPISEGRIVLMDLDVQGGALVRGMTDPLIREAFFDIFVLPPTEEELAKRLRGRGTETDEQLNLRLQNALEECGHWPLYTYTIVSSDREADYSAFESIFMAERLKSRRRNGER